MADTIQHVTIKGVTYDLPSAGSGAVSSVNGQTGAVVLDADDVGALPDDTAIPSKTSDLTNDSGFITSSSVPTKVSDLTNDSGFISSETDPTVPSWAKQSSKPSYTAQEVGALPSSTSIPSKTSDLTNDSGFITSSALPTKTSDLTNDSGFITTSALPTKVSDLTNDSGFISTETDPTVPSWAKASSKPTYTASEVGALPDSTTIPSDTGDLTNGAGFITANDVSGSYLPLTAGNGNALTGDLYINESTPHYYLQTSGTNRGNFSYDSTNTRVEIYNNAAGSRVCLYDNGVVYINGNGYIRLRPNNSDTGQVSINTNGQLIGGHPLEDAGFSTAVSVAASTAKTIKTISSLVATGVYLITASVRFVPSATTSGYVSFFIHTVKDTLGGGIREVRYTNSTSPKYLTISQLVTGETTQHITIYSGVAGSAESAYIKYVRLS